MIKNIFKILFYFISCVSLGAAVAFLIFKIIDVDDTGRVPVIVGKSVTEAEAELNRRKLLLSIKGKEYHDEIPEEHITSQAISPEERIKAGTEVEVIVSRGQEIYSMPSFEGQLLEDAKLTISNLEMKINKLTWVHSDSVREGEVIAQRPLPGNITGNEVNFLVSLGPYKVSYRCPSFVNMTIDDARVLAKEIGIRLIEKDGGSRVIFQQPEAGVNIENGDAVEVKLGRGWGMWF